MQGKTNQEKSTTSRRTFLASNGALAAGLCLASAPTARARETLAVNGGKKAVAASAAGATSWPHFGEEERKAVDAVVTRPGYGEIEAFENDWKAHFQPPYCK